MKLRREQVSSPQAQHHPAGAEMGVVAALMLGGISRPTYSQMPWEGMSGKGLSPPHSQKGFFSWEGSCCTTQTFWEPSLEIWLGEKVRRGDPLACSPPGRLKALLRAHRGAAGARATHRGAHRAPRHARGARRGAASISSIPSNEFRDNTTVWICFLLGSSRRGRGRKERARKDKAAD